MLRKPSISHNSRDVREFDYMCIAIWSKIIVIILLRLAPSLFGIQYLRSMHMLQAMCVIRQCQHCLKILGNVDIACFTRALSTLPKIFRKCWHCLKFLRIFTTDRLKHYTDCLHKLPEITHIANKNCLKLNRLPDYIA